MALVHDGHRQLWSPPLPPAALIVVPASIDNNEILRGGPRQRGERQTQELDKINKINKILLFFNLVNLVNPVKKLRNRSGSWPKP